MRTRNTYYIIKQIHLYSSLAIVAMLIMYIATSFMMIYHDSFKVDRVTEDPVLIKLSPEEKSDENWQYFIDQQQVAGRLTRENFNKNGDLIKTYSSAGRNTKITIFSDRNEVEKVTTELNSSGKVIGLHRMRGYGGPLIYNIYAILLDLVGISLILFAVTGVVLWLNLLKNSKIAWSILALGFIYVTSVVLYLLCY